MSDLDKTVDFIKEIEKLKSVTRFNRTLPEKLNMEKVISMLLIHDLGEIYVGDTWVFDDKKRFTLMIESQNLLKKQ